MSRSSVKYRAAASIPMIVRLIFLGSPRSRCPVLEALLAAGHEVALVVTQPDRPAGRGRRLHRHPSRRSPASTACRCGRRARCAAREAEARAAGGRRRRDGAGRLCRARPEERARDCRGGILNVHPSLLPRWRGAAPIQAALLAGDDGDGREHHSAGRSARRRADPAPGAGADRARGRLPHARAAPGDARRASAGPRAARAATPAPQDDSAGDVLPAHRARGRAHRLVRSRPRRTGTRCAPIAAGRRRSRRSSARQLKVLRAWPADGSYGDPGRRGDCSACRLVATGEAGCAWTKCSSKAARADAARSSARLPGFIGAQPTWHSSGGHAAQHWSACSPTSSKSWCASWGEPAYRGRQIFHWLHRRGVLDPAHMTDLPPALRAAARSAAQRGSAAACSRSTA